MNISKYSNTIEYNLKTTLDDSGINKLKSELSSVQQTLVSMESSGKITNEQLSEATSSISKLNQALNSSYNHKLGMLDLSKFQEQSKQLGVNFQDVSKSLNLAGTQGASTFMNLTTKLGSFNTGVKSTSSLLDKFANTLGNTVRWGITSSMFNGMTNALSQAVDYAKELDDSLTQIMLVTDYSRQDMIDYAKSANEAAKALGSTTTDMTNATLIFAQQGYNLDQSNQLAQMSTKLANASQQTTSDTSDQITAYMNAYGLDSDMETLSSALDSWAEVANVSAADVAELAEASQRAASTANTVGVSMDQLNAQIATIESVTRDAPEQIGNGLKTIYARFSDISLGETLDDGVNLGTVTSQLEKIGVQVLDGDNKMRNVGDIMEDLMGVWSSIDSTQKAAVAQTLAGKNQLTRFEALMNRSDLYDSYKDSSENADGTLDTMNDKYVNSLEGKMKQLQSTFEGIITSLTTADDWYPLIDALTNALDLLNDFIDSIGGGTTALSALGAIATKVFSTQITSGIQKIINNKQVKNLAENNQKQAEDIIKGKFGKSRENFSGSEREAVDKVYNANLNKIEASKTKLYNTEEIQRYQEKVESLEQAETNLIASEKQLQQQADATNLVLQRYSGSTDTLFEASRDKDGVLNLGFTELGKGLISSLFQDNAYGEDFFKTLSNIREEIDGVKIDVNTLMTDFNESSSSVTAKLLKDTSSVESFESQLKRIIEELTANYNGNFLDNLNTSAKDSTNIIDKLGASFKELVEAREKYSQVSIDANSTDKAIGKSLSILIAKINQAKEILQQLSQLSSDVAKGNLVTNDKELNEANQQHGAVAQQAKNAEANVNGQEEETKTRKKIETNVQLAQSVMSLTSAWLSFQNLGDLWTNDDISLGEKILQTVENLTFSLPMMTSSFSEFLKVKNNLLSNFEGLQEVLDTVKSGKNATEVLKDLTGVFKKAGTAAVESGGELTLFSAIMEGLKGSAVELGAAFVELLPILGAAAVAGLAIAGITGAIESSKQALESQSEKVTEVKDSWSDLSSTISTFKTAYQTFKDTGEVTDDFTQSCKDAAEALDVEGANALIAAGDYDKLADKIKKAQDQKAKESISEIDVNSSENNKSLEGTWNNGSTDIDYSDKLRGAENIIQNTLGDNYTKSLGLNESSSGENDVYENISKAESNINRLEAKLKELGDSYNADAYNGSEEKWNNEKEAIQEAINKMQEYLDLEDVKTAKDNASAKADIGVGRNDFQDAISSADNINDIKKIFSGKSSGGDYGTADYFKSMSDDYSAQLKYMIENVEDENAKAALEIEQAKVNLQEKLSSRSEEDANNIQDAVDKSGLSAAQKVTLVGELDKDATLKDVNEKIEEIKTEAVKVTIGATLDTSDLETASESKSSLQDLMDSYDSAYESNGGFTEDEAVSLIEKNSEYAEYLTKVGDAYQLNTKALAAYTDATREQTKAMEELRGESVDMSENNDYISQMMGQDDFDSEGWGDTLRGIQAINQELTNGNISTDDFLDGLEDSFDTFADKCSSAFDSASQSFEEFIDTAENADLENIANLLGDELYQGLNKATKQAQSGESSMADYTSSLKKAATRTKKLVQATGDLTDEQVDQIDNSEDLEKTTEGWTDAQKSAAKQVSNLNSELKSLDSAATFSSDIQNQYKNLTKVFDDTGTVIDSVKTSMGGIQQQYSGTISTLAQTVSAYCSSNEAAMQNAATAIQNTGAMGYEEARTLLQSSTNLGNAMQSNASVASAVMTSTMESANSSISNIATGISGILTALMSNIGSTNGTITGEPETTEGTSVDITTSDGDTVGNIKIPGFKMNIKGSNNSSGGSKLTSKGYTKGDTSYNAETDQWETTYTKTTKKGKTKTKTVQASATDQVKAASNMLGAGIESFGKSLSDYSNTGPGNTYIPSGGSGSGSGGSGGSGDSGDSGSSYEAQTEEYLEDEEDLYEKVQTKLDHVANDFDKIADAQDRLTGKKLAENMTEQIKLLQKQIALYEEKLKIQQKEQADLASELSSKYGVTFDSDGFIANYSEVFNRLKNEYNSLVDQYNSTTTEDGQEAIKEKMDAVKDELDDFNDTYQRYDELISSDIQDTLKQIEDLKDEIEDLRIEAFKTQIEAVDNLKDIKESFIDFERAFNRGIELSPFDEAADDIAKLGEYFDLTGESADAFYDKMIEQNKELLNSADATEAQKKYAQAQIDGYTKAKVQAAAGGTDLNTFGTGYLDLSYKNVTDMAEQVEQYLANGTSDIFGEDSADLYDVALDVYNQATELVSDFWDTLEDLHDKILDEIDEISDAMDRRKDQYEAITDELEHQSEVIELLHGEESYDELNEVLAAQQTNYLSELDTLTKQRDIWKEMLTHMTEGSEEWNEVSEKIQDATSDINDLIEDSLDNLQTTYENMVNKITSAWTTNALGTDIDWMSTQWELINRNADYYLDDVNKAYNIQKLQGKYLDLLDDASNSSLATQQKISNQMNQQLDYLREKTSLSEYDVSYAEAQLEILQKQIALEEAQQNKSQMKLRRDTQGNYSYVYAADDDNVRSAESDLLDAQNNAYNLSKDQMQSVQENSLSALQDAQSTINDIWTNANLTLEEKTERTQTIIDSLKEYLSNCADDLTTSETNIIQDFLGMCEMLTDENRSGLEDTYQLIKDGNNDAFDAIDTRWSTSITTWLQNINEFGDDTQDMLDSLVDAGMEYQDATNELASTAGANFNNVTDSIKDTVAATDNLASSTDTFIKKLQDMASTVQSNEATLKKYQDQITNMSNEMSTYVQKVKELQNQVSSLQLENTTLKNTVNTNTSGGNGSGGGSGNTTPTGVEINEALALGIAKEIYTYKTWGDDPTRSAALTAAFGSAFAKHVQDIINQYYREGRAAQLVDYTSSAYSKKALGYATGGYTGDWTDGVEDAENGKLAFLHQKELVLNASDTENILAAVDVIRTITDSLKSNAVGSLSSLFGGLSSASGLGQEIEQNVHIIAEFPNANSASEIESALLSLNERAVQYAFKTN